MQVWPALSSLPWAILSAASCMSQSASMMHGDLPPSSSVVGVRLAAAACATLRPTAVDPVNTKWSKGSEAINAAVAASPCTTQNSSGAKNCATSAASWADVWGVSSLGLSITRLPAASAPMAGPSASCTG